MGYLRKSSCILLLTFLLLMTMAHGWSSTNVVLGKAPTSITNIELIPQMVSGLAAKTTIIEDEAGIPHIFATKTKDLFFMQGFLHARDRFFQMDVSRRSIDGTLAELLGAGNNNVNLRQDAQIRAFGFTEASQATLPLMRSQTRSLLTAYVRGVNAYLDKNPLPPEYRALNLTKARKWTEVDSINVLKGFAFTLNFNLNDMAFSSRLQSYQTAGQNLNFDGSALFFEDLFRFAPFDPAFTVADANGTHSTNGAYNLRAAQQNKPEHQWATQVAKMLTPRRATELNQLLDELSELPFFAHQINVEAPTVGSNWLIASGNVTDTGAPLLVGDPHLALSSPPIWYQIQMNSTDKKDPFNVIGVSVPGAPGVAIGHNDNVAWSATVTEFDLTDIYLEDVQAEANNGLSTLYQGKREPVMFRNAEFRVNQITSGKNNNMVVASGLPTRLPFVPRRNNGPLQGSFSFQYVGLSPTLDLEGFLDFNRAKSISDFQQAAQAIDGLSLNFAVAATNGDIAYFSTGELPLREDLEAGQVNGVPPFFVRNGQGGNEWLPLRTRQDRQSLANEILPFSEMPQVINPARNFIVSANNDPLGISANNNRLARKRSNGGIYYLGGLFSSGSRAFVLDQGIAQAVQNGGKLTIEQARRLQASVKMRDAEVFVPYIRQALDNALRADAPPELAALADSSVREAVARFSNWDFTGPTGLRVGYDAFMPHDQRDPSEQEINNSVSATIYSIWRGQIIINTFDAVLAARNISGSFVTLPALRNLLDNFSTTKGIGKSGLNFFSVPELAGSSPEVQRDFLLLQSLRQSLDLLAGPAFQAAFQGSTNQMDYRWGMLHRVILAHPLNSLEFNIPSNTGNFVSPLPGLYGLPRDGGFEVANSSNHNIRGRGANDFTFQLGSSVRLAVIMKAGAIKAFSSLPGGQNGNPTSKFHDNLLAGWLIADLFPLISDRDQLINQRESEFSIGFKEE